MIQIIKEGITKQITCKNCGAVLSYNKEDIKYPEQQYAIGYGGLLCNSNATRHNYMPTMQL